MDRCIDIKDEKLLAKFPDVKVLKVLEDRKVVYYCAVSKSPEEDAMAVILPWVSDKGLLKEGQLFGFNNPSPKEGDPVYGYEFQVTVSEDFVSDHSAIDTKRVTGGLYAVMSSRISKVSEDWQRFMKWLDESSYELGSHQWLEEMYDFEGDFKMTLYLPIKE